MFAKPSMCKISAVSVVYKVASCKAVVCEDMPQLGVNAACSLRSYIDEENQKFATSCSEFEVCFNSLMPGHSSLVCLRRAIVVSSGAHMLR